MAYRQMDHRSAMLSRLQRFQEQGRYWDVVVLLDTAFYKCQRLILAANSEYFENKLLNIATARQIIVLPDVDEKAFVRILHYMYADEIYTRHAHMIHKLLVLSDFLGLHTRRHFKELMVRLVRGRSEEPRPMSCAIDLLRYAYDKEENVLVEIMAAHICLHLCHFSEDARLMQFSFENLNALLERSKIYTVWLRGSADFLVKIVNNWVNCNRRIRSQYRAELMENVDFANFSSDFILSLMNRVESIGHEVSNLSSKVRSLSELKTFAASLELGRGKTVLLATISLDVPDVSVLPIGREIFSPSCAISNLLWRITFERDTNDDASVSLCCKGIDLMASEWNICAKANITIKSHKAGVDDFSRILSLRLFSSASEPVPRVWSLKSYLPWNELVDPEKGYVADDDSIALEAHLFLKRIH